MQESKTRSLIGQVSGFLSFNKVDVVMFIDSNMQICL